jgi:hypothetical protein
VTEGSTLDGSRTGHLSPVGLPPSPSGAVKDLFRVSFLQPRMVGELSFLAPTSPQGHTVGSPYGTRGLRQRASATLVAPLAIDHHIQETLTSLASSSDISLSSLTNIELIQLLPWTLSLCITLWHCYIVYTYDTSLSYTLYFLS